MFRIRRIFDDVLQTDQEALGQIKAILQDQFDLIPAEEIQELNEKLRNPLHYRLRHMIHVAEDQARRVKGFAITAHAPDLKFCFLDYIAAAKGQTGSGTGSALYQEVREECGRLGVVGLFFECLPDEAALCPDPALLKRNAARLRFYERYGARPIAHTSYETPFKETDTCAPHLVFDSCDHKDTLPRHTARAIVRAILERKYGDRCPPGYIDRVVSSFRDNPVTLRPPRYIKKMERLSPPLKEGPMALIVTDEHEIHHVRSRGYVESPIRIQAILRHLQDTGLFTRLKPEHHGLQSITAIHDPKFIAYFGKACSRLDPGKAIYPYVFPVRNAARPPRELPIRAGYYCMDTFTPLSHNAYRAARRAVDCAMTGASAILEGGFPAAYALVRPPGHHAEHRIFGGFCYFNSAAAAAQYLSHYGRVALLDIDYHHGNGAQEIFYERADVLTLSIHAHPRFAYPYFTGFPEERGAGPGEGFNGNYTLPEGPVDGPRYRLVLQAALHRIHRHRPRFLVVSLGLDTARGDPTGSWSLTGRDFEENGRLIGHTHLPVLVVQEGGYRTRSIGVHARLFFQGLLAGLQDNSVQKPLHRR